jgi:hypothetical protein
MTDYPVGSRNRLIQSALILSCVLFVAAPASLVFLHQAGVTGGDPLSRIGDILMLVVFPMLALQPVLSARLRILVSIPYIFFTSSRA